MSDPVQCRVSIRINMVLHMCYDSILWDWWMNEVTTNRLTIVIIKVIITRSFVRCYQDHAVYYQLARSVCQKLKGTNFHRKRKQWWTHGASNSYIPLFIILHGETYAGIGNPRRKQFHLECRSPSCIDSDVTNSSNCLHTALSDYSRCVCIHLLNVRSEVSITTGVFCWFC